MAGRDWQGGDRDDRRRRGGDNARQSGDRRRDSNKGRSGAPRSTASDGDRRGHRAPSEKSREGARSAGGSSREVESKPRRPPIDDDVTGRELDKEIREELSALGPAAGDVARHLVMAQRLVDDDPGSAWEHAFAARRHAGRIGIIREAAGVAAYLAGKYTEALAELRAARRMTGSAEYLPMMADAERGLGRPVRALDLANDPAITGLDTAGRVEMLIVAAGARRDLGEHEAAAVSLQVPELRSSSAKPWVARLRYAYADALLAAGRVAEARQWFIRAADADPDAATDAAERATEIDSDGPA